MSEVQAVKRPADRDTIYRELHAKGAIYADAWICGINLGLRAGDLLALTMENARTAINHHENAVEIVLQKSGHKTTIYFSPTVIAVVKKRLHDNPEHTYLFQSSQPSKCKETGKNAYRGLAVRTLARAIEDAGKNLSNPLKLASHSIRKTFGVVQLENGTPIERISYNLDHKNSAVTFRYLGLDKQSKAEDIIKCDTPPPSL